MGWEGLAAMIMVGFGECELEQDYRKTVFSDGILGSTTSSLDGEKLEDLVTRSSRDVG